MVEWHGTGTRLGPVRIHWASFMKPGTTRLGRPDFVFFSEVAGGGIVADIVDPHGHQLADSLPKLRGLADYADQNANEYGRIEAISEIDGQYRILDCKRPDVKAEIHAALSARSAYLGNGSARYNVSDATAPR